MAQDPIGGYGPHRNPQPPCEEVQYERQIGIPSGLVPPFGLGISVLRTGVQRYRSCFSRSMIPWTFWTDMPSTVSLVDPIVIAPKLR